LENYWLLQERQPEIGGALSCHQMLAFFASFAGIAIAAERLRCDVFPVEQKQSNYPYETIDPPINRENSLKSSKEYACMGR